MILPFLLCVSPEQYIWKLKSVSPEVNDLRWPFLVSIRWDFSEPWHLFSDPQPLSSSCRIQSTRGATAPAPCPKVWPGSEAEHSSPQAHTKHVHSTHTGHCKLSTWVNTAGTNSLFPLLAARGESPLGENAHMCTCTHTQYDWPSNCPWLTHSLPSSWVCPASSTGPHSGCWYSDPSQTCRYSLQSPLGCNPGPLYSSAVPQSLLLLHAKIHTLMGVSVSARPQSLCSTWPGLPAPPAISNRCTQVFFWTSWPLPSLFSYSLSCFTVLTHHTTCTPPHLTLPRGPLWPTVRSELLALRPL